MEATTPLAIGVLQTNPRPSPRARNAQKPLDLPIKRAISQIKHHASVARERRNLADAAATTSLMDSTLTIRSYETWAGDRFPSGMKSSRPTAHPTSSEATLKPISALRTQWRAPQLQRGVTPLKSSLHKPEPSRRSSPADCQKRAGLRLTATRAAASNGIALLTPNPQNNSYDPLVVQKLHPAPPRRDRQNAVVTPRQTKGE